LTGPPVLAGGAPAPDICGPLLGDTNDGVALSVPFDPSSIGTADASRSGVQNARTAAAVGPTAEDTLVDWANA
jgi:hypothetical protein